MRNGRDRFTSGWAFGRRRRTEYFRKETRIEGRNNTDIFTKWWLWEDTPPSVALDSPSNGSSSSDTTPELAFTGTDADGDDVRYRIQISPKNFDSIILDTSGQASASATTSVTQSIAVAAGNNRKLVVAIANNSNQASPSAPASVTYNGDPLTMLEDIDAPSGANNVSVWELAAPDTGTNNLVITATNSFDFVDAGWIVLQNASQAESTADGMQASSVTAPGVFIPCPLPGSWALSIGYPSSGSVSGMNGATEIITGFPSGGYSRSAENGPISHIFFGSASTGWALAWVAILPAYADGLIDRISGNSYDGSDNFDDNSIDTAKWDTYTANGGTVSETSQQLQLTCANATNGSWAGIVSDVAVDLRGKYCKMRILDGTGGNTYLDLTLCKKKIPSTEDYFISIGVDTGLGNLQAYKKFGGNIDTIMAAEVFSPTNHQYVRIRESGGMVYWEYSADDSTWTELWSEEAPIDMSSVYIVIDDYEYNGSGNPGTHIVDSFVMGVLEGSAFFRSGDSDPFASGQQVTYTVQSALAAGTYYWRVRGNDPSGSNTWGNWSAVRNFIVSAAGGSYTQTLTDTITLTDSSGKIIGRIVSESVSAGDAIMRYAARIISDSASVSDTMRKTTSRIIADSAAVSDSSHQSKVTLKMLSESVTAVDSISRFMARALNETITIVDSVVKMTARSFAEAVSSVDSVLKTAKRTIAEAITASDSSTQFKAALKILSETVSVADSIVKTMSRILSESLSIADSAIRKSIRVFAESVSVADSIRKVSGRIIQDSVSAVDSVRKTASKVITDSLSITDSIVRVIPKVFFESVDIADSLVKTLGRTASEALSVADFVFSAFVSSLSKFSGVIKSVYGHIFGVKAKKTVFTLNSANTVIAVRDTKKNIILRDSNKSLTKKL